MRMSFEINETGQILMPAGIAHSAPPRQVLRHPIYGMRMRNEMLIHIAQNSSSQALLSLLQTIRSLQVERFQFFQHPHQQTAHIFTKRAEACLFLGRIALSSFEQEQQKKFASHLSFFTASSELPLEMPFFVRNIIQMKTVSADLPTVLTRLDNDIKKNGSYFCLDAEHHLKMLKLPEQYSYPPCEEFQDIMASPHGKWVDIVGQVALATRLPLLQFGQLRMHAQTAQSTPFARVAIPFIDTDFRFVNFRVITLAFLPDNHSWMV